MYTATFDGLGARTYKFAGGDLPHVRLPKCLLEVGAIVAMDFGYHRRLLCRTVLYLGSLSLAAVTD